MVAAYHGFGQILPQNWLLLKENVANPSYNKKQSSFIRFKILKDAQMYLEGSSQSQSYYFSRKYHTCIGVSKCTISWIFWLSVNFIVIYDQINTEYGCNNTFCKSCTRGKFLLKIIRNYYRPSIYQINLLLVVTG